jgi:hypothetical protein
MFRTTICSSSGGQLYECNFWYNHSVLVAVRYAGQEGTECVSSWLPTRIHKGAEIWGFLFFWEKLNVSSLHLAYLRFIY